MFGSYDNLANTEHETAKDNHGTPNTKHLTAKNDFVTAKTALENANAKRDTSVNASKKDVNAFKTAQDENNLCVQNDDNNVADEDDDDFDMSLAQHIDMMTDKYLGDDDEEDTQENPQNSPENSKAKKKVIKIKKRDAQMTTSTPARVTAKPKRSSRAEAETNKNTEQETNVVSTRQLRRKR